jgi:hypothetical protein
MIQESPEKSEILSGKRQTLSLLKNTFMKQRQGLLHQSSVYVPRLSTVESTYVHRMSQNRAHTPLILFKNKKTGHNYREGKAGMHLAGENKP